MSDQGDVLQPDEEEVGIHRPHHEQERHQEHITRTESNAENTESERARVAKLRAALDERGSIKDLSDVEIADFRENVYPQMLSRIQYLGNSRLPYIWLGKGLFPIGVRDVRNGVERILDVGLGLKGDSPRHEFKIGNGDVLDVGMDKQQVRIAKYAQGNKDNPKYELFLPRNPGTDEWLGIEGAKIVQHDANPVKRLFGLDKIELGDNTPRYLRRRVFNTALKRAAADINKAIPNAKANVATAPAA